MGTINITQYSPATGETSDATKIASTNTALQTLLNGLLDNANVSSTAAIAASKIVRDIDPTLAANSDTVIPSQKAVKTYADMKMLASYLDTDVALTANSDAKVPSQKAIKTYADSIAVSSTPADNTVTSAKIVDGAIVNADINASAAIAKTKLAALNIADADVAAGAAIAKSKLAALNIAEGDIADAAVTGRKLAGDPDPNKILRGNGTWAYITESNIEDGAVTFRKVAGLETALYNINQSLSSILGRLNAHGI